MSPQNDCAVLLLFEWQDSRTYTVSFSLRQTSFSFLNEMLVVSHKRDDILSCVRVAAVTQIPESMQTLAAS